ncbi:MAG: 3'-5' exoribonuclease [Patescibacteria group bacterium]|nr:3'-5' exoribonuclease [Patescibacteria group bacterium]
MEPFSNNIVFIDTEFSDLNPYHGEILSIALVKPDGQELYLELEYDGPVSDWVRENIVPTLTAPKVPREEAKRKIKEFLGGKKPYAIGFVNQYDTLYIYKLFRGDEDPFYWMPIDFASILFGNGKNPEASIMEYPKDKYREHNALDDARFLRDNYLKFFQ